MSGDDDDEEDTAAAGKGQSAIPERRDAGSWRAVNLQKIMEGCPSNEYLKIGGSIYGFYTHGIAIGFDHTERYTEEAIAAEADTGMRREPGV